MQKYLEILEKNVEWIALGLGGLYLLIMVWFYVIGNPVTTQVNNQTLRPGTISEYIARTQVEGLRRNIEDTAELDMQVEPFAQRFAQSIQGEGVTLAGLPNPWINSPTTMIDIPSLEEGLEFEMPEGTRVAELPQPPTPTYQAVRKGRSTVSLPEDQMPLDPLRPQRFLQQAIQPAQADRDWVTVSFIIPMDDLAREFRTKNIPEMAAETMFLRLELVREERQADGTWAKQTIVPPSQIQQMPNFPGPDNRIAQVQYHSWAAGNQVEIIRPGFYTVLAGDEWLPPGFDPEAQMMDVAFDPYTYEGRLEDLPPEQRQQVQRARREMASPQQRQPQDQMRQPQPRSGREGQPMRQPQRQRPGRGGMEDIPFYAPRDPDRSQVFAQVRPGQRRPMGRQYMEDMYWDDPAMMDDMYMDMPGMGPRMDYPGLPPHQAQILGSPTGRFNPAQLGDLEVWAHDETVESGKTYRYSLRYMILNPIYGVRNIAADPALESVFALASEQSEWSEAVRVDEQVRFFVSRNPVQGSDRVTFQIFHWLEGMWNDATVAATPGDLIRVNVGDTVVSTGWTLVDVREDGILLMDSEGQTETRSSRTDAADLRRFRERIPTAEAPDGMMPGMMNQPPRAGPRPGGMGPGFTPGYPR
jgi:hypothetical protein